MPFLCSSSRIGIKTFDQSACEELRRKWRDIETPCTKDGEIIDAARAVNSGPP